MLEAQRRQIDDLRLGERLVGHIEVAVLEIEDRGLRIVGIGDVEGHRLIDDAAVERERLISVLPTRPLFVVITTTPFDALEP
mgnify:CR=1 FL=1